MIRLEDVSDSRARPARARRSSAVWAALAVAAASVLLVASPAVAHDDLAATDPVAGATLDALPGQLTLTFTADIAPDAGASEVQVTDASGATLTDGAPVAEGAVLTQPLAGKASGAVTVLWKVVSSDGHPISGELSFTVTPAATSEPSTEPTATTNPTVEPTPIEIYPDMTVDWGATLLVNLLPVLAAVLVVVVVIVIVVVVRRRRRS